MAQRIWKKNVWTFPIPWLQEYGPDRPYGWVAGKNCQHLKLYISFVGLQNLPKPGWNTFLFEKNIDDEYDEWEGFREGWVCDCKRVVLLAGPKCTEENCNHPWPRHHIYYH